MSPENINAKTLAEAEKLAAIELTAEERVQVLKGLRLPLSSYQRRRLVELRNSDAPALRFDPRLAGVSYPPREEGSAERPLARSADPGDEPLPAESDADGAPEDPPPATTTVDPAPAGNALPALGGEVSNARRSATESPKPSNMGAPAASASNATS